MIDDWQIRSNLTQTWLDYQTFFSAHDYPPWLQYWRVRSPLLAGRLEKSPFLSFEGESTSATAYKRSSSQTQLYIGFRIVSKSFCFVRRFISIGDDKIWTKNKAMGKLFGLNLKMAGQLIVQSALLQQNITAEKSNHSKCIMITFLLLGRNVLLRKLVSTWYTEWNFSLKISIFQIGITSAVQWHK